MLATHQGVDDDHNLCCCRIELESAMPVAAVTCYVSAVRSLSLTLTFALHKQNGVGRTVTTCCVNAPSQCHIPNIV